MTRRGSLQKLVRDRIPELIKRNGQIPIIRLLNDSERLPALLRKLDEEHTELQTNLVIEEVIDMIEVLLAVANQLGHTEETTLQMLHGKRIERGGFENGVWLIDIQPTRET
jgi:predicted house-cleaning noncanonical NTP pyrophosphatase (MazG superfamily)